MGKARILVVEDDQALRELICRKLKQLDYDVQEASDGHQGLELIVKYHPDVIVSDVIMPNMDGNKMLKIIRDSTDAKDIPLIVITARVMMRDYFEMLKVNAFIEKPFKMDDLVLAIEHSLAQQKSPDPPAIVNTKRTGDPITVSDHGEDLIKDSIADLPWHEDKESSRGGRKEPIKEREGIPANIKGKAIAILERNRDIWPDIKRIFTGLGFRIEVYDDVDLFGKMMMEHAPDIILISQLTRQYNALILAQNFKRNAALRKVPIIIYDQMGEMTSGVNEAGLVDNRFILNAEGRQMIKKVIDIFGV